MDHHSEDNQFQHRLCSHLTITGTCQVEYSALTTPSERENHPPPLNKLEIVMECSHQRIAQGTAETVTSRSCMGMDVIRDFKSYNRVRRKVVRMLSEFEAHPCCFDYVTDHVLLCACDEVPETLGGPFLITAEVLITVKENLDVDEEGNELMDDSVTESMEEDNVRRIPASKLFIDGLKKEKYRQNNHGNSCVVCLDGIIDGSEVSNMPCSHMFHSACLIPWLHESNSCPVCRYQVDPAE
ncbi:hypothetical protein MKW94_004872 [Papaver nudicaule]|uniref:RING-type domain-containing protein n=1 Tax=Papaver nudicaule TaxID=74823 RepID=A0AA41S637_PAPNU|nr:hypothetical protein [Papaver nudicaule]